MKKRALGILLVCIMVLSIAACAPKEKEKTIAVVPWSMAQTLSLIHIWYDMLDGIKYFIPSDARSNHLIPCGCSSEIRLCQFFHIILQSII